MGIEERVDDILSERLEEIAKLCLSASEPAIHKEVRNYSFTFSASSEE